MIEKRIQLYHGSGGAEGNALVKSIFFKKLGNAILEREEDAALIPLSGTSAFSTDSYIIKPIFFPGGDIGKLAVCGTSNDLCMMGARPKYLSLGFIIEEGFLISELEQIVDTIAAECRKLDIFVACGDTKVAPKGSVDGIFINSSGVGEVEYQGISAANCEPGDLVIASSSAGDHGAAVFALREGIELKSALISDCRHLYFGMRALCQSGATIKAMRDTTRGGMAASLNELANTSSVGMEIEEAAIPLRQEVKGICEILGIEPYMLANEGAFVAIVNKEDAQKALGALQGIEGFGEAAIIGTVTAAEGVRLTSPWGTKRYLEAPTGELLPRIC